MIPTSMKYNAEGSAPSFSDTEGMTVERGSQVRLRIKGIRGELGQMFAIGSIREDYLGYVAEEFESDGFTADLETVLCFNKPISCWKPRCASSPTEARGSDLHFHEH